MLICMAVCACVCVCVWMCARARAVTRVIAQCLGRSIFTWGDQIPYKAFDVLIATVMQQTVCEKRSADCLHISLLQGALEAAVSQDVTPSAPTSEERKVIHLSSFF